MTTITRIAIALAVASAVAAPAVWSQTTLYKLIDRDGKVTYVQEPPKDFDGKVIRLDIDPKANVATFPKPPAARAEDAGKPAAPRAQSAEELARAARARLEEARMALADAQSNPREGELRFIGNVGGGTRPIPTPEYQARLEGLEQEVRNAEEELRRAEQAR